ncbi:hypothetical protein B0J12DRAFT_114622 [Macrophomina phaseolina]|uniref:Zn(2)-C6 fungal-type domain-containing protein n=1 Tax=Macrophomina phaseolina TaxID=35725 RepID=A0ABQ8G8W9_9PEZI|nr:hypothetical protein B0J12DRAFT_114622 [Macrophomina phaseolina]
MNSDRPLLPAPPDPRSRKFHRPPLPPARPLRQRISRSLTLAACLICRHKKTKCDGARPTCARCKAVGEKCVYDVGQGERKVESAKNRVDSVERDFASAMQALHLLHRGSDKEAEHLYRRLRLAPDLPSLLSNLTLAPSETALPPVPPAQQPLAQVDIPGVLRYIHDNQEKIRRAFSLYAERTINLFHVYTEDEAAGILAQICEPSVYNMPGPVLCETCSIVAIASHFDRHQIPPSVGDLMYNAAKHLLDDLVLQKPLRAIKVCALMILCNVITKATVALTYIDVGLGIARRQGLSSKKCPPNVDQDSWIDAQKVLRSLVLCKGWLESTLGCSSDEPALLSYAVYTGAYDVLDAAEFFRTEFTKISIIKAKILRTTANPNLSQNTIDSIRADLQSWYNALPVKLRLSENLHRDKDPQTRITVSYLHVLHLGTIMLLHRRIVSCYVHLSTGDSDCARIMIQEATQAVDEGVHAARLSARLLALLLDDGGITRHCWICIFQSYMSCCALLFSTFHDALHRPDWPLQPRSDIGLSEKAFKVLSFCAKLDPVAASFERTLSPYMRLLKDALKADGSKKSADVSAAFLESEPALSPPPRSQPLFPPNGSTVFHQACAMLFKLLSEPFSSYAPAAGGNKQNKLNEQATPNIDELGFGMHMDWIGAGQPSSSSVPEGMASFEKQPFGWRPVRGSTEYLEAAQTLDIS